MRLPWFKSELDKQRQTAKILWNLLNQEHYASAKELAHTPLLLTFLCLVYDRSQKLPTNRASLYNQALDILLQKWDAEKRVQRSSIYQDLDPDQEKSLLSKIAFQNFKKDQLFFSENHLLTQIKEFLVENLNAPQHLNAKAVLEAIEVQQGILVERTEDVYSFSHLTLQEFLTARYICQNHRRIETLIEKYLYDRRWREVFLLIAGILDDAAPLIAMIQVKNRTRLNQSQKLINLLRWANNSTFNSVGDYKPCTKRIGAIAFALILARDLNQDLDVDISLELAITLALEFNLDLSPTRELSREMSRELLSGTFNPDLAYQLLLDFDREFNRMQIFRPELNLIPLITALKNLKNTRFQTVFAKANINLLDKICTIWWKALALDPSFINFPVMR